ncbi:MAG TPA: type I 3-dehydroquinate dehydratase [Polyangia bacterium]|nr:type I 3-dehydroquinate dehydratase [Polyangia bacterium]
MATSDSLPAVALVGVVSSPDGVARFAASERAARVVDLLEVRVDLFDLAGAPSVDPWADPCARVEASGTPVLVTIRLAAQGGRWSRPDGERLPLYRAAAAFASWLDVEAESPIAREVVSLAHAARRRVILSHHDFARTPPLPDLERVMSDALAAGADIAKLATLVATDDDRAALFTILARHAGRACVIGMGARSSELRIDLPARGSRLAYGYVDTPTAPGQLSADEMADRLTVAGLPMTR